MALIPNPTVPASAPILGDAVKHAAKTGGYDNENALKLVVQTVNNAENHANYKDWATQWSTSLRMYRSQSKVANWGGGGGSRNNFPMFVVSNSVNNFVPQILDGLFADNPPFVVNPRPGTKYSTSQAVSAVLAYQIKEDIGFRKQIELFAQNMALFGTGIAEWGVEEYDEVRTRYKRCDTSVRKTNDLGQEVVFQNQDDPGGLEPEKYDYHVFNPTFRNIDNLKQLIVDSTLAVPDIRQAKFVAKRKYMTWQQLEELRDDETYTNLPSKDELISWFLPPLPEPTVTATEEEYPSLVMDMRADPRWIQASADALSKPLEVLEYWTNERVVTVLQRKRVLRNTDNPYGVLPFLSCNLINVPGAFWGIGMGEMVGPEQRLQQGIINAWLDVVALSANPMYLTKKGENVLTQSISSSPGLFVRVDDPSSLVPFPPPPPVQDAGVQIAMSQSRVEQSTGNSSSSLAGATDTSVARTAAGVHLASSGPQVIIAKHVDDIAEQVFVPFLEHLVELDRLMPEEVWKRILDAATPVQADPNSPALAPVTPEFEDLVNAGVKFDMLAGTKMRQKQAMAQALPVMSQTLLQKQVIDGLATQGKKIDFFAFAGMWFTISGWPNKHELIVDMTPQEVQFFQQNSPMALAQLKTQATLAQKQNDLQGKKELQDQKDTSIAARDQLKLATKAEHDENAKNLDEARNQVLRQDFEHSSEPFSATGEANPNLKGFGGPNL